MRTIVIMNRRFLSGPPTNDQHFNRFITTNPMAPVVAFLEAEVRLQVELGDLDRGKPGVNFFQRRRTCLTVQCFDQVDKCKYTLTVQRFKGNRSFTVDLCRQKLGSEWKSRA